MEMIAIYCCYWICFSTWILWSFLSFWRGYDWIYNHNVPSTKKKSDKNSYEWRTI